MKPIAPWTRLDSTYTYRDRWLTLRSDTVRLGNGRTLAPYHVVEGPDWVNVVALSAAGNIVLVEQYRHAVQQVLLELPAGQVDPREDHDAAMRRELLEETGYGGGTWHALDTLFPAASRLTTRVTGYLALGLARLADPVLEDSEDLRVREMPWDEFAAGLRGGSLRLREANQMSTVLLVHLLASASADPAIARLRL